MIQNVRCLVTLFDFIVDVWPHGLSVCNMKLWKVMRGWEEEECKLLLIRIVGKNKM